MKKSDDKILYFYCSKKMVISAQKIKISLIFSTSSSKINLKLDHLTLLPLVTAQFKALAPLNRFHGNVLFLIFTISSFHFQHNLFSSLSLFVKNRLGLTTIT